MSRHAVTGGRRSVIVAFVLGVVLTAMAGLWLRSSQPSPAEDVPVPTSTAAGDAPFAPTPLVPRSGDGTGAPGCHLGVVLAQETVDVASEIEGQLQEVNVRVGDAVARGRVIAALDTASLGHQLSIERATLRTAEAERRRQDIETGRAKQEHQRRLALEGLLSKEDEEKARFQAQTAAAMFEATEAEVSRVEARIAQLETRLRRSEIRAPFDAVVSQRYLDPGAVVRPGAPILRLISAEGLLTRFAVRPQEASTVPVGTAVRVEVETLGIALDGVVEHVAPEIDGASQRIFVEARIDGSSLTGDGETPPLPSGAAARVTVVGDGRSAASMASCLAGGSTENRRQ